MEDTITISKKEYIRLLVVDEKMNRLDRGGIDNWEWYGEAMYPNDEPDFEEFRENLEKKFNVKGE